MATRRQRERSRRRTSGRNRTGEKQERLRLPYGKDNAVLFAVGIGVLVAGYICLAQPPVDGFLSLTLAPILLVVGYCVLIPLALLKTPSSEKRLAEAGEEGDTDRQVGPSKAGGTG